jgi:hypothetical protein
LWHDVVVEEAVQVALYPFPLLTFFFSCVGGISRRRAIFILVVPSCRRGFLLRLI